VRVSLRYGPAALEILVDDEGPALAAAADGSGHGLLGMRERVAALGGALNAGPRPGGGYRVAATIPRAAP